MIRVEFHCHTTHSHDAFTTERELATACIARGINVVTITEHDVFVARAFAGLEAAQVRVVHGCEFTCNKGTHIIGLFLERHLGLSGHTPMKIVEGIRAVGGVVYLPHPFKPGTGYFTQYRPDPLLDQVDMIEIFNGGFASDPNTDAIRALARQYDIRLVAGSDSHAAAHVGHYVSEYDALPTDDLRHIFRTKDPRLMIDASKPKAPRSLNWIQRSGLYQWQIQRIPPAVKRPIKAALSRFRSSLGTPGTATYREIL